MSDITDKLHPQKDTPEYTDCCEHPDGSYLGSIRQGPKNNDEWLDVYVYEDSTLGQSVCIRYGENDQDYYSPGNVLYIAACIVRDHLSIEAYALALHLLLKKGKILFVKGE